MKTPRISIGTCITQGPDMDEKPDILAVHDGKPLGIRAIHGRRGGFSAEDMKTLILTAAALELRLKGADPDKEQEVTLAVGEDLPGLTPEDTKQVLAEIKGEHRFLVQEKRWTITVRRVHQYSPFKAWLAAAGPELQQAPRVIIADFGASKVKAAVFAAGKPEGEIITIPHGGTLSLVTRLRDVLRREGARHTDRQIDCVLRGLPVFPLPLDNILREECKSWAERIMEDISDAGLDLRSTPFLLAGGGANTIWRYWYWGRQAYHPKMKFTLNLHAKAEGFEKLCRRQIAKDGPGEETEYTDDGH